MFRELVAGVSGGARLMDLDALKRKAAAVAVEMVEGGMLVGLGTGSTTRHAIEMLGERFRGGLRFTGVPTSLGSAALARSFGIPLIESPTEAPIDLTIDGADEVGEADLSLIKGMIVVDETKMAPRLSGRVAIPVEVVSFGWESTRARLTALGCTPELKRNAQGEAYRSDGGNLIFNCGFASLPDPAATERALAMTVGVVETGLFLGLATTVLVASGTGVRRIDRPV